MNPDIRSALHQRLRRAPSSATVPGSLPVLFFGDLFSARVATVGINPSWQEYLERDGQELTGTRRRFETLISLGAPSRSALTDEQADRAIQTMRGYFRPGGNVYSWFAGYARVMDGMGVSYVHGTAAHLDLVQESTDPVWGDLRKGDPTQATALLHVDVPFLKWQIARFPLAAIVCTSSTVARALSESLGAVVAKDGTTGKRRWAVATARVAGRVIGLASWDRPLAQAPGLTREEQHALGVTVVKALRRAGVASFDARGRGSMRFRGGARRARDPRGGSAA